jgi:SAM-dependent methyltransferase
VLDIGCGQGALLEEIRRRMSVEVVGFDLRPAPPHAPVPIFQGNAVSDPLPAADVAVCVVMAHHLSEAEVAKLIQNVARSCDRLILLDLVRHPVPLLLFRLFVRPFLCRINGLDGQTSIRRAYTVREMRKIVDYALAGVATESGRPVLRIEHSVAPLWIRQVVHISWEAVA